MNTLYFKKNYQVMKYVLCVSKPIGLINILITFRGDSGSALIVRRYIQIGLVSYKKPHISKSDIVYTDIGYYYDWIVTNAKELLCQ